MQKEQQVQEDKYNFPYHYVPTNNNDNFRQTYNVKWGYEYVSYINFVISELKKIKFNSLVDVGCGDGRFINKLNKDIPNKYLLGIDYSENAISLAKAMNSNLDFVCADITENDFNNKYDAMTLIETLEHIPLDSVDNFIKSISKLIKQNGYLIITVPSDNCGLDSHHFQNFNKKLLESYLNKYFKIENLYFLNKFSRTVTMISKILTNKYFILNNRYLLNKIFKFYYRNCLITDNKNARRICAVCKKI